MVALRWRRYYFKCFYFDCMRRFLWIMLFPGLHWKRDWMSIVWHDHQRSCWHDKQGGIWQSKTKPDPVRLKWPDLQDGQDYHRAGFRDTEVNFFKTNITFACLPVFLTHHGVQIIKIIPRSVSQEHAEYNWMPPSLWVNITISIQNPVEGVNIT